MSVYKGVARSDIRHLTARGTSNMRLADVPGNVRVTRRGGGRVWLIRLQPGFQANTEIPYGFCAPEVLDKVIPSAFHHIRCV